MKAAAIYICKDPSGLAFKVRVQGQHYNPANLDWALRNEGLLRWHRKSKSSVRSAGSSLRTLLAVIRECRNGTCIGNSYITGEYIGATMSQ